MWGCGLKLTSLQPLAENIGVTPYVGVWIEILNLPECHVKCQVTPYVGVWIEMFWVL